MHDVVHVSRLATELQGGGQEVVDEHDNEFLNAATFDSAADARREDHRQISPLGRASGQY